MRQTNPIARRREIPGTALRYAPGRSAGSYATEAQSWGSPQIHRRRYPQGDVWQLIGRVLIGGRLAGRPALAPSRGLAAVRSP